MGDTPRTSSSSTGQRVSGCQTEEREEIPVRVDRVQLWRDRAEGLRTPGNQRAQAEARTVGVWRAGLGRGGRAPSLHARVGGVGER